MKNLLLTFVMTLLCYCAFAQTNTFPSTGNVGIGTTSPTLPLTVQGTAQVRGLAYFTQSTPTNTLIIDATSSSLHKIYNNAPIDISIGSNSSPSQFYLKNDGSVGIGTTSPLARLHIAGNLITAGGSANIDGVNLNFLAGSSQMLVAWNKTGGRGEIDFVSNQGAGDNGGFAFYNHDNSNVETQLMYIHGDGTVSIGTSASQGYKLAINGSAIATSMTVKLNSNWPDYVFKSNYNLPSLNDLKTFIEKNQHLPEMPSEQEIAKDGLDLGEMNKILVKKVEELTLYLIQQKEESDLQKEEADQQNEKNELQNKDQQRQIDQLKRQINKLIK